MKPTVSRTFTTTASPEAVFDYLADFTNTEEWDPGTVSTRRVSGDGGVGTKYRNVSKFLGRKTEITYTTVAARRPNARSTSPGTTSSSTATTYGHPAHGRGAEVTYTAEFEFKGLFGRPPRVRSPVAAASPQEARRRGRDGPATNLDRLGTVDRRCPCGRSTPCWTGPWCSATPGSGSAVRRRAARLAGRPRAGRAGRQDVRRHRCHLGLGIATAEGLAAARRPRAPRGPRPSKGETVRDELAPRSPGAPAAAVDAATSATSTTYAASPARSAPSAGHPRPRPQRRRDAARAHRVRAGPRADMAVHVLGPVLMTELLRPQLPPAGRVVLVTRGGMYGQTLRADDPEYLTATYSPTTAYARSKRAQVELLPVLAERWCARRRRGRRDPPGLGRHPGRRRRRCPRFRRSPGRAARRRRGRRHHACGWPAPSRRRRAGRLWHDRVERPIHIVPTTRAGEDERARAWAWLKDAAGLAG